MRWLVGAIVACALLAAVLAWRIAAPLFGPAARPAVSAPGPSSNLAGSRLADSTAAPSTSAPALIETADTALRAAGASAASEPVTALPESVAAPGAAAEPAEVHWAVDQDRAALSQLAAAREALARDPYHRRALADELAALRRLQRWPEAAETLSRLVEVEPQNARLRLEYAEVLLRLGRWMNAVNVLRVLVEQTPDDPRAWYYLAAAQHSLGHLEGARRSWSRVIELTPDDASAYGHRAQILLDQRDWAAAAGDCEQALRLDPEQIDMAVGLATAWSWQGRSAEAEQRLLDVLQRHPGNVRVMNCLAEVAWRASRAAPANETLERELAIHWCRKSLEIDPQQPAVQALLDAALAAGVQP